MTDLTFAPARERADTYRPGTATAADFIDLLKPRVMSLVVFTGLAGLIVAPGALHPVLAATAILCIAIAAGGAGAINMWYDRDIDAVMARTAARPIPSGRVRAEDALGFGVVLSLLSVLLMGLAVNWVAAALLALANLYYVFVYTIWLKRRTPQNIVIGGAAGAFPPMIGWAAVTGSVDVPALLLFLVIFMWTPPHFWALALFRSGEYQRAGIPMLPVVAGTEETKRQIFIYATLLWPLTVAPYFFGLGGIAYLITSFAAGALFFICALRVLRDEGERAPRQMFGFSILFLFLVFAMLIGGEVAPAMSLI